jgi:hypothetical protein
MMGFKSVNTIAHLKRNEQRLGGKINFFAIVGKFFVEKWGNVGDFY